jgi:predicted amidophosphoribosyltransferase
MAARTCQRCGKEADLANRDQVFCDACWALIKESWPCCLSCGQVFQSLAEHHEHMNWHRFHPRAGELHYSIPNHFVRLPGR